MPKFSPYLETPEQRLADLERQIRRAHDFLRVLAQVLKRRGALTDADAADLRTMCPHTAERVL